MKRKYINEILKISILMSLTANVYADSSVVKHDYDHISFKDISPEIYYENEKNRKMDMADSALEVMRNKKKRDLSDPNSPQRFEGLNNISPEFISSQKPWNKLEDVFPTDWSTLNKSSQRQLQDLAKTVKVKTVMDHPDLKIIEIAIGPNGILPQFSDPAPGAFHILGGDAEITVGQNTVHAYTGTSIKLEPLSLRRIEVKSKEPLKLLWFRWAPNGQEAYLNYGYYLTGTNFHIQPYQANMPENFEQWDDAVRKKYEVLPFKELKTATGNNVYKQNLLVVDSLKQKANQGLPLYPNTPTFLAEKDRQWIDFTKLDASSGFFFAADAEKNKGLIHSWNKMARMKGVFRAIVPNKLYDFNLSYLSIGPKGKYVTHSHATPEFYYILGGKTEWEINKKKYIAEAGNTYFHSPYYDHEMLGLKEGSAMVALTGSWAPFGDRTVFDKKILFTEALPTQKEESFIQNGFNFYDFKLKKDLKFQK
ncbi:MAG: hypothetical protein RSD50_06920 [Acinetobacter sp.]